ncbi:MAG TPA: 4Fe-4S single cluster domain-containing protein [bacterium]|nr:4Fe-4S single cluster domain-containing protein [bacterium]HPN95920.1 4Fe-4S single cluster domain-containing protein [bacterium]
MEIRLNNFVPDSDVDGPGRRASVFVQGCSIRCDGCATPWMWDENAGKCVDADTLIERILNIPGIEGVTFLGGEPFDQSKAVSYVAKAVREKGLSIVTFTGRTIENIRASGIESEIDLLKNTDLLIDGPFIESLADDSRPWVGSTNQRYLFLTSRYKKLVPLLSGISNKLEIRIYPDGRVFANGLMLTNDLKQFVMKLIN